MKKPGVLLTALFLVLSSFNAIAQSKTGTDYFIGKWHVLIPGTPLGDLKRFYIFEKNGESLSGQVQDGTSGAELAKFTKVELKGDQVTAYYSVNDLDVTVVFIKKDEDHITGTVLGTYDATGERVKVK